VTHDAAAQVLSPGCGFGRSAGRARFENVSSFRETLSRERGLARRDRVVRRKGKVRRARHGGAASGCFGQQRPWTELRGGAAL